MTKLNRKTRFEIKESTSHRSVSAFQRNGRTSEPVALLIACSDPILDSTLLEQLKSQPMVVWRNRGPIVPPYGSGHQDAAAVLEHAISDLGVREIVICGHLPNDMLRISERTADSVADDGPATNYVAAIRRMAEARYQHLDADEFFMAMMEESVFSQMANLRTYPAVLAGLAEGQLKLHNWIYDARKDELYGHSPVKSRILDRMRQSTEPASHLRPFLNPCDIYLA